MTSEPTNPNQEAELDPGKEYRALVRSIHWTKGFGLLFVQCSPAEGNRLIERVRKDLPEKRIEVLLLKESVDNLYDVVDALPNKDQIDTLFIQGLEYSLYEYEKTHLWDEPGEQYIYSEKGLPRLLGNLNLGRERFAENFKFHLVFLVPSFVLKYLIRRAPDFFDWRSGVLEFHSSPNMASQEFLKIVREGNYWEYSALTQDERNRKILEIQALLDEQFQDTELRIPLVVNQAALFNASGELKESLSALNQVLLLKQDDYSIWRMRGSTLLLLERYEEGLHSFDKAIQLQPKDAELWIGRGTCLLELERYQESVDSYDKALKLNPNSSRAWFNRGDALDRLARFRAAISSYSKSLEMNPNQPDVLYYRASCYARIGRFKYALESLEKAIQLNSDYREWAKSNSAFDWIRKDDRFQALINEKG